jgi:hypothetical protein
MSDWISVKDKLPEHHSKVLVLHKSGDMFVMRFTLTEEVNKFLRSRGLTSKDIPQEHPYEFSSNEVNGMCLANVTHWMPLPKGIK